MLLANPIISTCGCVDSLVYSVAMYSRKRIGDSGDPCGTLALRVCCVALALLKTSVACLSLRKLPSYWVIYSGKFIRYSTLSSLLWLTALKALLMSSCSSDATAPLSYVVRIAFVVSLMASFVDLSGLLPIW